MRIAAASYLVLTWLLLPPLGITYSAEREKLPGILGQDDRIILENRDYPWSAIGRVNGGGYGFCTGTLVEKDVVLTAAHCLYHGRTGRRLRPNELVFLPGYQRGEYLAVGRVRSVVEPSEFSRHGEFDPKRSNTERIANDWALLLLTRKLPLRPLTVRSHSPNGVDKPASDWQPVTSVGYSQDRAHLLSLHTNCAFTFIAGDGDIIVHTCDATRGASGSPLLIKGNDGYTIIGVVTGAIDTSEDERGFAVHASAFTPSLAKLRHRPR